MKKLSSLVLTILVLLFVGTTQVFAAPSKQINANIKTKKEPLIK